MGLDTGKNPSQAWGYEVSGNYFDALVIQPYLGRFFHASDEHGPNSAPYIVLSYAYWHSHFQDDRGVVGRVVRLNKHPFTILGVAPPDVPAGRCCSSPPISSCPSCNQEQVDGLKCPERSRERRDIFMVLGHLKPGVTPAQAVADLNSRRLVSGEDLSQRRMRNMTYSLARPSLAGDMLGPSGAGIPDGIDAAGRIDSAGCMRQPGQPVCRARRGPLARSCSAARAGIEPQTHSARHVY